MPITKFNNHFESEISMETDASLSEEETPFRMLMLGDWAGSSLFFSENLASRRPLEIDRDNFDDVIAEIRPEVRLDFVNVDKNKLKLVFTSLDDFHPDQIFQKLPIFSELKDLRQKLLDPNTFNSAASEVRSWYVSEEAEDNQSNAAISSVTNEDLLDSILGEKTTPIVTQISHKTELSVFISDIVAPYKVTTDLNEQSKLIGIIDEVISDLMRKIIHHEEFQKIEAVWRGIDFLVKNVETDTNLKIYLFQLSKSELSNNLSNVSSLTNSPYFKIVAGESGFLPEDESWALVSATYDFQVNVEDIATLIRISKISSVSNTPFISNISPKCFGFDDDDKFENSVAELKEASDKQKLWLALRAVPTSEYIGMVMPPFIGRFPYGMATDPTEVFAFEEFSSFFKKENYLWILSSFAYSLALAQEFRSGGWNIDTDKSFNFGNLPLHVYLSDYSPTNPSCVKVPFAESDFTKVLEHGIMPIISFRNSDSIRLSALRSVSLESPILKGRWNRE